MAEPVVRASTAHARWSEVEPLLDAALELPAGDVDAFLELACGADRELRGAVEALLAADAAPTPFIERPVDPDGRLLRAAVAERESESAAARVGERLGPYRLLHEIGRGGMGSVYLAERADGEYEQRVAVKVVRHWIAGEEAVRRFRRERQILALLEHPRIARLIDGGVTADGLPWLAMEHVEGLPLTAYCEEHGLDVRARLRLVRDVCAAVHVAHGRAIIHRDLKPSNILVTGEGEVKLLDFGIARMVDHEVDADVTRTDLTRGNGPMTPEYAAPEQLAGADATTATDVFQLGLVLHEVLVGRPTARSSQDASSSLTALLTPRETPTAALRSALTETVDTAARAAMRERLGAISRDLDAVVMKALALEPRDRYRSAAEMAEDLQRVLDGSAVSARPATAAGRLLRLSRRHPVTAGAVVVAIVLLIVAGLAFTDALQWRARGEQVPRRFRLLSNFPGSHRAATFSPDGSRYAYVEFELDPVPQIWLASTERGLPRRLTTGSPGAGHPRWSPRGDQILFERSGDGVWVVPASGGTPRRLLDDAKTASWSWDGTQVVFERKHTIWLANADGSGAHAVAGVPTDPFMSFVDLSPALSPDGRWIAFFLCSHGPNGDLWVMRSAGGGARQLTHDMRMGGEPVWTPDGRWIVYSSARSGSTTLWRIAADGGEPMAWTAGSGEDVDADIDRTGRHLLYTNAQDSFGLAGTDPATGRTRILVDQRGDLVAPEVSYDGRTIAFFSQPDEGYHVFTIGMDGRGLRQLTSGRELSTFPRWSLDGKTLYFNRSDPGQNYMKLRLDTGKISPVLPGVPITAWSCVDPTERLVATDQGDPWNPEVTWITELATGKRHRLAAAVLWPAFTPDGKTVVGFTYERDLLACPADGSPCHLLAKKAHTPNFAGLDSTHVYFLRGPRRLDDPTLGVVQAYVVDIDGKNERYLADLGPLLVHDKALSVSPTGELFWTKLLRSRHQIWIADLP